MPADNDQLSIPFCQPNILHPDYSAIFVLHFINDI